MALIAMAAIAPLLAGGDLAQVSASAANPFPTPVYNVLSLHMNTDGLAFKWFSANPLSSQPTPTKVQPINVATNCAVTLGSPTLVAVSAAAAKSPNVGFNEESGAYGLGVTEPGEGAGTPCGRVDSPDQQLTIQLAGNLANFGVTHFELDLEAKFGAIIDANLYWNSTFVGTQELNTSSGAADSGSDAKTSDHYRWVRDIAYCPAPTYSASDCLKVPFNKMVLVPKQGAFSLSAGAVGTHPGPLGTYLGITDDSLFQLSNVITCGQTVTAGGNGNPTTGVTRGSNTDNSTCDPKAYDLTTTAGDGATVPNVVKFSPIANGDPAQYTSEITWPPVTSSYLATHDTLIDDGVHPVHPIMWCIGSPTNPRLPTDTALGFTTPELWCRLERDQTFVGTNTSGDSLIQVHEKLYGQGDPAWDF